MQANVSFAKENFDDIWPELEPLTRAQWEEVPNVGEEGTEYPVDPALYSELYKTGRVLIYTLRVDGAIKGYSAFFLSPLLDKGRHTCAKNITLYLDPEYRGGALSSAFIQAIEEDLEFDEYVYRVDYQFKPHRIPRTLMDVLGYKESEVHFTKVLG